MKATKAYGSHIFNLFCSSFLLSVYWHFFFSPVDEGLKKCDDTTCRLQFFSLSHLDIICIDSRKDFKVSEKKKYLKGTCQQTDPFNKVHL